MSDQFDKGYQTIEAPASDSMAVNAGLRTYMLSVYNYMATGVLITGIVAMMVSRSETLINLIFGTGLYWVVMLSPLAFILAMNFGLQRMRASTLQTLFWVFSGVMGLSLASIFLIYTGTSIAQVFFVTAGAFGALSLYGYTTKKDLSGMGTFLMMGLFGLIIAMIVNFFMASSIMDFVISVIGVLIFAGLTAYDTQKIKSWYFMSENGEMMAKSAIYGALHLYLDFINMFLFMLRLFGNRG